MKADPFHQARLLDLQRLDTRLDQIAHARTRLPVLADLEKATAAHASAHDDLVRAQTALGDLEREQARADADVQLVRDRAERDRSRLAAGTGTAKDLQAIQHELDSLARRQSELEDVEIEVMERVEAARDRADRLRAVADELAAKVCELTQVRDAEIARLDAELEEVAAPREELRAGIDDGLVGLYESLRSRTGGVVAAPLEGRSCGGCRIQLNPVDLRRIADAPSNEVLRCDECDRILVRVPEGA